MLTIYFPEEWGWIEVLDWIIANPEWREQELHIHPKYCLFGICVKN